MELNTSQVHEDPGVYISLLVAERGDDLSSPRTEFLGHGSVTVIVKRTNILNKSRQNFIKLNKYSINVSMWNESGQQ